jgi:hypothetical protein
MLELIFYRIGIVAAKMREASRFLTVAVHDGRLIKAFATKEASRAGGKCRGRRALPFLTK